MARSVERPRGDGLDTLIAGTLQANGKAAGSATQQDAEAGMLIPIAFSMKDFGGDASFGLAPTLRAGNHDTSHANGGQPPAIAFDARQNCVSSADVFGALGASNPQAQAVAYPIDMRQASRGATMTNNRKEGSSGGAPGTGIGSAGDPAPTISTSHVPAVCITGDITHTLKAEGFDASEDGTGRGQPIIAHAIQAGALRINPNSGPDGVGVQADLAYTLEARSEVQCAQMGMAVRRLTPRECERLQSFPDVVDTLTIEICRNPNEVANSATAKFVAPHSPAQSPAQNAPVALHVQVDFGAQQIQLRCLGKLRWSANIAEPNEKSPLPIPIGDFVQLLAAAKPWLAPEIQTGEAESPLSTKHFIAPSSGSAHALISGSEIKELVNDAEKFTVALRQCLKSTTSQPGQALQNSGSTLQTLSCCVAAVMSGFIPTTTCTSSISLLVEVITPYTLIPVRGKPAADGPRYKALGNSWCVYNARWIGRRIDARLRALTGSNFAPQ